MRLLHKIYAWFFGYFWLPCPVCGKEFGGHEVANKHTSALVCENGHAYGVCPNPKCSEEARARNHAAGYDNFL